MQRPSDPHRHFALQLTLAIGAPLEVAVAGGSSQSVAGVVLAPQVEHSQFGATLNFFVDPLEPLGRRLRGLLDGHTHRVLPAGLVGSFWGPVPPARWLQAPQCPAPDAALDALLDALGATPVPELDPRVAKVVQRLREDIACTAPRAGLAALAEVAGLSRSRLTHLFTEQVGLSIKQYVVWLRMVAVLERFSSSAQLGTLAHGVGFPDQAAFARAYRQTWGRTPTSFRRSAQLEDGSAAAAAAAIKRR